MMGVDSPRCAVLVNQVLNKTKHCSGDISGKSRVIRNTTKIFLKKKQTTHKTKLDIGLHEQGSYFSWSLWGKFLQSILPLCWLPAAFQVMLPRGSSQVSEMPSRRGGCPA